MIGASRNFGHITEERDFTNPRVRFRRINGRIVPILNKKRIGQELGSVGAAMTAAGGAIAGYGVVGRMIEKKFPRPKVSSPTAKKFASKSTAKIAKAVSGRSIPAQTLLALGKAAKAGVKFTASHPIKVGAGLAIAGLITRGAGWDMEAASPMGKDY